MKIKFDSNQAYQHDVILAVYITEKLGSFRKICSLLGNRNITKFSYRYANAKAA